jgi:hypothetical protein
MNTTMNARSMAIVPARTGGMKRRTGARIGSVRARIPADSRVLTDPDGDGPAYENPRSVEAVRADLVQHGHNGGLVAPLVEGCPVALERLQLL